MIVNSAIRIVTNGIFYGALIYLALTPTLGAPQWLQNLGFFFLMLIPALSITQILGWENPEAMIKLRDYLHRGVIIACRVYAVGLILTLTITGSFFLAGLWVVACLVTEATYIIACTVSDRPL